MSREAVTFREALTDAIRFWERRRIIYNLVLAVVVAIHAVIFAAYVPDIPAQLSGFRAQWLR